MRTPQCGLRASALAGSLMLCCIVLLSARSDVPTVPIPEIGVIDEGETIAVVGLVADLWAWDDGTEILLLVDTDSEATARIVCYRAIRDPPSAYLGVGDEVRVLGQVYGSSEPRSIYSNTDGLTLLRESRFALTVDALSKCWTLYEGDEIDVRGVLARQEARAGFLLRGLTGHSALVLISQYPTNEAMLGMEVVVSGTLVFDPAFMGLVLHASSVRLAWQQQPF